MRNLCWYLGIASMMMFAGSALAQGHSMNESADACGLDAYYAGNGAIAIDSFSLEQLVDGDMDSGGTNCMGKLYLCDDGSGGTSTVQKKADCDNCAANHCDGCCSYFCTTPACKTRCCANECGTVC